MDLSQLYFENLDLDFTEQFVHAKSSLGVSCECLLIVGHPGGSLVNISGRVERGSCIMVSWWKFLLFVQVLINTKPLSFMNTTVSSYKSGF